MGEVRANSHLCIMCFPPWNLIRTGASRYSWTSPCTHLTFTNHESLCALNWIRLWCTVVWLCPDPTNAGFVLPWKLCLYVPAWTGRPEACQECRSRFPLLSWGTDPGIAHIFSTPGSSPAHHAPHGLLLAGPLVPVMMDHLIQRYWMVTLDPLHCAFLQSSYELHKTMEID